MTVPDYSLTRTFPLTAISGSITDIVARLITHWAAAPGLWQRKGSQSVAGEAITITEVGTSTQDIAIRRIGTTQYGVTLSSDMGITAPGNSTTEPTKDADASPECRSGTLPTLSPDFLVVETPESIFVFLQDAAQSLFPSAIHSGLVTSILRANDPDLGMTGHAVLVGAPTNTGNNAWFRSTTQTNGSRIRVFDSAGAAHWVQVNAPRFPGSTSNTLGSASEDGLIRSTRPFMLVGLDVNSSNDLNVGVTRWIAGASIAATFANQPPRVRAESSATEAWVYIGSTAGPKGVVGSWQRTINP